jgi:hypothetical protein
MWTKLTENLNHRGDAVSLKTELQLVSTENLKALLASDTIGTFERETIIRILNERRKPTDPPGPAPPNPVSPALLDAQLRWIDSL